VARQLLVDFDGEVSSFELEKHSREKLYGLRRRIYVDEAGEECQRALLSEDGSLLLPPGGTADLYLDEGFDVVERGALRAVDAEGNELPPVPSTLGRAMPLDGPVPPTRVLDFVTPTVYALEPATLGEALKARLEAGEIFETTFAYRDGFDSQTCFLLRNEEGWFALVGRPAGFEWTRRATPVPAEGEELEFEDDLDFGMM
jgi:hypothetical protein